MRIPKLSLLGAMLGVSLTLSIQAGANTLYIYDGDTIRQDKTTYRIVGLNTPETRGKCDLEIKLALRAKARLVELRDRITITPVTCTCSPSSVGTQYCNYGRSCARVTVSSPGGHPIDWAIIAVWEGLAEPYECNPKTGRCPKRRDWCQGG